MRGESLSGFFDSVFYILLIGGLGVVLIFSTIHLSETQREISVLCSVPLSEGQEERCYIHNGDSLVIFHPSELKSNHYYFASCKKVKE